MLKSLQDNLVTIKPQGAHESIISHLTHPQDRVAVQAMEFLAALVCNGNEKAQEMIGQSLRTKDTELFTRMETILESAVVCIKADPCRQATYNTVFNEVYLKIYCTLLVIV